MPEPCAHHPQSNRWPFGLRLVLFLGLAALVLGAAWQLLHAGETLVAHAADQTLRLTMAGFEPSTLVVPAGKPSTLQLVNPDSAFHRDGGGMHQFAVPELGIDVKVPPRSTAVITLPATAAGTYTFYCDVCCGGKENPSMRGTLRVS